MLIVLDDVLDAAEQQAVQNVFAMEESRNMNWVSGTYEAVCSNPSPLSKLVLKAGAFFDLSSMVGVECWSHFGTYPGWHKDRDEALADATNEERYPLCSIVYYGLIDDLVGGDFRTETVVVTPKTNRALIFSPGILHSVDNYTGARLSIAINPWAQKPMGYS